MLNDILKKVIVLIMLLLYVTPVSAGMPLKLELDPVEPQLIEKQNREIEKDKKRLQEDNMQKEILKQQHLEKQNMQDEDRQQALDNSQQSVQPAKKKTRWWLWLSGLLAAGGLAAVLLKGPGPNSNPNPPTPIGSATITW